jgi:hypothetical protein
MLKKPKEGPPREGFFEGEQFEAVRRRFVPDPQVAVSIAYTYGWRMQSEILRLERRHADFNAGALRLDAGMTKNDAGRVIYLTPELKAMPAAQAKRVEALQARLGRITPGCSRTAERGAGPVGRVAISARRGRQRAGTRACRAGYDMTSGGQRCGTWSTGGCLSGWP